MGVKVNMSYADGKTMDMFAKVIAERQKWCRESAKSSITACAINALVSLRSKTMVAKQSSANVEVRQDNSLHASCSTSAKRRVPCIRWIAGNKKYTGQEYVRIARGARLSDLKVYRYKDDKSGKSYIIAASSMSSAKSVAKKIAVSRIMKYAGLAKRALGELMHKAHGPDTETYLDPRVALKADEVTTCRETVTKRGDGGVYMLQLNDVLRYALEAIKGGRAEVDNALKRSMNKTVSVINQELKRHRKDFFRPFKLDTPFPELKQRRAN